MKNNIAIFAGTTEGRTLVEKLIDAIEESNSCNFMIYVCVTTEYGKDLLGKNENIKIHVGALNEKEIALFFDDNQIAKCFDATHPYAQVITKSLKAICEKKGIDYYRIERESNLELLNENPKDFILVDDVDAAVSYLEGTTGEIFITTGSKELKAFTKITNYRERCIARVLSTENVVSQCKELGFEGKNLICMQGPFSEELNTAMFKQANAAYVVTKESGNVGGFLEKCVAARKAGAKLVVIKRPEEEMTNHLEVIDLKTAVSMIIENQFVQTMENQALAKSCAYCAPYDMATPRGMKKYYMVGMGPGNPKLLTTEAREVLENADCIIGAKRIVEIAKNYLKSENKVFYTEYRTKEILEYCSAHEVYEKIAFVFSGDIGFYSGARKLIDALQEEWKAKSKENINTIICIPGISSPLYLCDRLGISWQDRDLFSLHGQEIDLSEVLMEKEKTAFLVGSNEDASRIALELCKLNKSNVKMAIGEKLSYEDECITIGTAKDMKDKNIDTLSVILVGGLDE